MSDWRNVPPPPKMRRLARDEAGRPIPAFVAYVDGKPDFRIVDAEFLRRCVTLKLCWICGGVMGKYVAFTIGPMCAVNRVSAEPPSHLDCATYAARACPFLVNPNKERRKGNLPENYSEPAGEMIERNPGVTLVWVTRSYEIERHDDGMLFRIGRPTGVAWWAEGRPATRAEVLASIDSGLPLLREMAWQDGPDAVAALERQHAAALELVPT